MQCGSVFPDILVTHLEVIAVKVTISEKTTTVVSLYCRSKMGSGVVSVSSDLRKLIPGPLLIFEGLWSTTSFGVMESQLVPEMPWFMALSIRYYV